MAVQTKKLVEALIASPMSSIGLEGVQGSGKYYLAKNIVKKILDLDKAEQNYKVQIIDCADNSCIDQMRELKSGLSIKATGTENYKRAIIFNNFESVSIPAQNSLLKILEEPPVDTLLVVLVDSRSNITQTVVSRLQWIKVYPVSKDEIINKYSDLYSTKQIEQAYLLSDGLIGTINNILTSPDNSTMSSMNEAKRILALRKVERIQEIDSIIKNSSFSVKDLLNAFLKIYILSIKNKVYKGGSLDKKLVSGLENIIETKESLNYNSNLKLVLTNMFYKM